MAYGVALYLYLYVPTHTDGHTSAITKYLVQYSTCMYVLISFYGVFGQRNKTVQSWF